jgi:hypothetical protein
MSDTEKKIERTLGSIEAKLDMVLDDYVDLKEEVAKNSKFRIAATAVGSAAITFLSWLGLR